MLRTNALTRTIDSICSGHVGFQLDHSGYIIASS